MAMRVFLVAFLLGVIAWENGSEAVTMELEAAAELADTTVLAELTQGLSEPVKATGFPPNDQFPSLQAYQKYMAGVTKRMRRVVPAIYPQDERILGEDSGIESPIVARQVAFGKPTAQSSTDFGASASRAVDGNTDTNFQHGSCTSTHVQESPWWRVDLMSTRTVHEVEVWNRGDCCGNRLSNFEVRVGDSPKWEANYKCGNKWSVPQGQSMKIDCTGRQGRYVSIVIPGVQQALVLCEVKVSASDPFGSNAALGKPTKQSSTDGVASSSRAVDGKTSNNFAEKSCTKTKLENEPWWHVDLEAPMTVTAVQVYNRGDCCGERLSNAEVRVGNSGSDWSKNAVCGSRFSVAQGTMKSIQCQQRVGRFVWVVIRERQTLTLCEVRVLTVDPKVGTNVARGKPALQSSTQHGAEASRAVDGNIDTIFSHGSCTHTHYDNEPWWRVDLEKKIKVGGVQIWNRGDCCGSRLSNFEVRVGMSDNWEHNKQCGKRHSVPQGRRHTIRCDGNEGRYVFVVIRARAYLNLCEVRVIPYTGDEEGCTSEPLGMESRKITNQMIRASSTQDEQLAGPQTARLNYEGSTWTALYKKEGEWLEVALKEMTTITAIQVQGSHTAATWVTQYKVKYYDGSNWKWYDEGRVLDGSNDQTNPQKTKLAKPFKASKVRLYPTAWHNAISMRVEIFGHTCEDKQENDGEKPCSTPVQNKCQNPEDEYKCVPSRPTFLGINSFPGYGEGKAKIWYAHNKGAGQESRIMGNSIYVDKSVDFRTQQGSIYSSKDLIAGRHVQIGAWPGYGHGTAQLRFADKGVDGELTDESDSNSLYLDNANLHVKEGSIISDMNVRAGNYLEIQAQRGHGEGVAQLWYSAVADEQFESDTLYLKSGNFQAEQGSVVAQKNLVVGEQLEISAFPKYGQGKAILWYVSNGGAEYHHNSLYLKDGNFRTQAGSIHAKMDLHAGRYLVLESSPKFGLGSAKLWYAKTGKNGFLGNTVYLDEADFKVHKGSIRADKDVTSGRFVDIGAYPGFGSGSAKLWYSQVGKGEFQSNSLYLRGGDLRTESGSIVAAEDVHATRFLGVHALPGHGSGKAELWYSQTARGQYAADSLYLKKGHFRTEDGSIVSGQDLEATRYITINALSGFGSGKASLWYCNKEQDGYNYNSLYLKSGDFRTEKGSIVASKDVVATEYLTLSAFPGYGNGVAEFWYSQTGRDNYRSDTVYLTHGDLTTQAGSIHAAKDLSVGRYLEIRAWPGHGSGVAQLWHGKKEESDASALYLKSGDFQTQDGSLISGKDVKAGRYVEIGATQGFGTGSAKLWFSRTGKGTITSNTLHLENGDFRAQSGSITAGVDVIASRNLKAAKMSAEYASITGAVEAGHLFLGSAQQDESLLEDDTTELLDVSGSKRLDVGKAMFQLDQQLRTLSDTNKQLKDNLDLLLGKVSTLEQAL